MSVPRRLFAKEVSTASTDFTVADLLYTAPFGGPTMVTALWVAASQGGTSNQFRIHHLLPVGEETVASSNVILHSIFSYRDKMNETAHSIKLIMQPGERLMGQLHAGDAASIHAFGLEPRSA